MTICCLPSVRNSHPLKQHAKPRNKRWPGPGGGPGQRFMPERWFRRFCRRAPGGAAFGVGGYIAGRVTLDLPDGFRLWRTRQVSWPSSAPCDRQRERSRSP